MKKDSDLKFYIWVGIIFLVIAAGIYSIRYLQKEDPGFQSYSYNGYTILNISNTYYTSIKLPDRESGHNIEMRFPPDLVDDIPLDEGIIGRIKEAEGLYLTTRPDLSSKTVIAMVEVGKIVGDRYDILNIPTAIALTAKTETTDADRRIASCVNATKEVPVIYFDTGGSTRVYFQGDCILVQGWNEDEIIRASDRLGYGLMGII